MRPGVSHRSADLRRRRCAGPEGPDGSQAGRHVGRRLEEADRHAYPIFHSAIAFDDVVSKKDFAGAIKEYTTELMLYPPAAAPSRAMPCGYAAAGAGLRQARRLHRDEVKAIWFYARAWDFAPASLQGPDRAAARLLVQALSRHARRRCSHHAADRRHQDPGTGNALPAGHLHHRACSNACRPRASRLYQRRSQGS